MWIKTLILLLLICLGVEISTAKALNNKYTISKLEKGKLWREKPNQKRVYLKVGDVFNTSEVRNGYIRCSFGAIIDIQIDNEIKRLKIPSNGSGESFIITPPFIIVMNNRGIQWETPHLFDRGVYFKIEGINDVIVYYPKDSTLYIPPHKKVKVNVEYTLNQEFKLSTGKLIPYQSNQLVFDKSFLNEQLSLEEDTNYIIQIDKLDTSNGKLLKSFKIKVFLISEEKFSSVITPDLNDKNKKSLHFWYSFGVTDFSNL